MSRQGHIGAYHARLAQRQRNPSLQNHAESTSASRKIAISQQGAFKYSSYSTYNARKCIGAS